MSTADSPPRRVKLLLPQPTTRATRTKTPLAAVPGTQTALVGARLALRESVKYRHQARAAGALVQVLEVRARAQALTLEAQVPEAQVPEAQVPEAAPGARALAQAAQIQALVAQVPEALTRALEVLGRALALALALEARVPEAQAVQTAEHARGLLTASHLSIGSVLLASAFV